MTTSNMTFDELLAALADMRSIPLDATQQLIGVINANFNHDDEDDDDPQLIEDIER